MNTSSIWNILATFVLRFRIPLLIIIAALTVYMWMNRGQKYEQAFAKIIPPDHPEYVEYMAFKQEFGEDGSTIALGIEGDIFRDVAFYNGLYDLTDSLRHIRGAESVISITNLFSIRTDTANERFTLEKIAANKPRNQAELDSIAAVIKQNVFYKKLVYNTNAATGKQIALIAISFDRKMLDTEDKQRIYDDVHRCTDPFQEKFKTRVHEAGFPVLRVHSHRTIGKEVQMFLLLAVLVCAISLYFFFRSFWTTFFCMVIVGVIIVWCMGLIGLYDYRINLMLALVPALMTVVAIQCCVYLITVYHFEYRESRDKNVALVAIIRKIGFAVVLINATTAAGFGANFFTDIVMLRQFGIITSWGVGITFVLSLVLVPIIFSFLPAPNEKELAHLDRKGLTWIIELCIRLVTHHSKAIFAVSSILFVISCGGMALIQARSYVADDLPKHSVIYQDLQFMQEHFAGVLPIEIVVDSKKKGGLLRYKTAEKISELQDSLLKYPDLSRSVSMIDFVKFARQAYAGGDSSEYLLPSRGEFDIVKIYMNNSRESLKGLTNGGKKLTDSTFQKARISLNIADIGSIRLGNVLDSIRTNVDSIFPKEDYDVRITGTTKIFVKGNDFLITNLLQSIGLAFLIIALMMGGLFKSLRMIVLSIVPNVLPLIMVAGLMGFAGIPLKPSTAIVFGAAFGIAVDTAIHFLAHYRLAVGIGMSTDKAIEHTLQETSVGIIYTSVILFFGFIIFVSSQFGGTQALGFLMSLTLLIAMVSNLLLLPALLKRFDKREGTQGAE